MGELIAFHAVDVKKDANLCSPEQHWTLMPVHAVLSTVRPASFLYGGGSGYGGPNAMSFPQ